MRKTLVILDMHTAVIAAVMTGLGIKHNDVSSNHSLKDAGLFCDVVFAIAKLADLNTYNICLGLGSVQFLHFTPAFTESNHAHGPPAFIL